MLRLNDSMNQFKIESLIKLLLQLLVKHFDAANLKSFNKNFFEYLKQTSKL